ncbi:MAG TPA: hypothetical protein EYP41_01210 [Anaerolineae bacterium]|nr:hypothetical protein [Anaerolineae bacterium]
MTNQLQHYRWEWTLQSSPEAVWPFFADTNRLNRDTGVFPVEALREGDGRNQNARHHLRYRLSLPLTIDYEEEPFEWIYPYRYGVARYFRRGPIKSMRFLADLQPQADGGTRLVYQTWVQPRNVLGRLASALAIGFVAPRRFTRAIRQYDKMASQEIAPYLPGKAQLVPGGRERLDQMREELIAQDVDKALLDQLLTLVLAADDLTVSRIRPYIYADLWGVPRRDVLELFLWSTRLGLLDFQWEVLCPLCRGPEDRVSSRLGDLESHAHCRTCNIDFNTSFENSVELTFVPNAAVRQVERMEYCVAGPEITPHIVAQQLLAARDRRVIAPLLEPGRYRLRALNLPGSQHFRVLADGRGAAEMKIMVNGRTWPEEETILAPLPKLQLQNETDEEHLFILERTAWSDQAATAAEVISLQRFRDLFANEALRPGERIGVGRLTVLFTDLVDSTRMYREIGDAPAFGIVMDHFDVLREAIDAEGGAIVKTIGDAVMAAFHRPVSAVKAMTRAQAVLANPSGEKRPLYLKAAVHTGSSIAVTLNERLDYFGTTINIASRLEKFSGGNDIIISENVYADTEVHDFLSRPGASFHVEPFAETLKGFDDECFQLYRIASLP